MDERVYPAEARPRGRSAAGDPHFHPPILEELKAEARARGLWNLFQPHSRVGPGLTNVEYAPLAEIMGRSRIGAGGDATARAPDTGNMEVLTLFGTAEQQERWLRPLLDGEIRSAFAMTEPDVASSDATNIADADRARRRRLRPQRPQVVDVRRDAPQLRAAHRHGQDRPEAPAAPRSSQMLSCPMDTPGVTIMRGPAGLRLPWTARATWRSCSRTCACRPPTCWPSEGDGFMISQARLGPGRIHHCMRSIGMAERALELLCQRAAAARRRSAPRRRAREHPGLDRRGAHRAGDGPAADAEDGVADGHRRQPARAGRDRRDQGRRARRSR